MENNGKVFDYESLANKYNISHEDLMRLTKEVRQEFPHDEMMFELHMIRALRNLNKQNRN